MKNLKAWAVAVVAGVAAPALIWAAGSQWANSTASTVISCETANACQITVNGGMAGLEMEKEMGDAVLGSTADVTTNWTAGVFSQDLTVQRDFSVSKTATLAGEVVDSSGNAFPKSVSSTMTNSTTTCALPNNSGRTRTLLSASALFASTPSAGAIGAVVIGTSTIQYATPTAPFVATNATAINGKDVITTTSTLTSAYAEWRPNEYLVWKVGTTTANGVCRALFL